MKNDYINRELGLLSDIYCKSNFRRPAWRINEHSLNVELYRQKFLDAEEEHRNYQKELES